MIFSFWFSYILKNNKKIISTSSGNISFSEVDVNVESFPWIAGRQSPDIKPKHKIISRSISKSLNSIVMLHTAGTSYVRNYDMDDLLKQNDMLADMDPKEVKLLKWVIDSENEDLLSDIHRSKQLIEEV